jgi:hypothetical protein
MLHTWLWPTAIAGSQHERERERHQISVKEIDRTVTLSQVPVIHIPMASPIFAQESDGQGCLL